MNAKEIENFLADSPPSVVKLEIKKHFEALSDKQKRYAHYISRFVELLPPLFFLALEVDWEFFSRRL